VTENWCLPKTQGRIDPNTFTPYPKNPLLANFFINIGRADVLGSGVRNLYRYTKIYSGGEPELIEGDVFRTIVPLDLSLTGMSDNGSLSDNVSDKMSDNGKVSDKKPADVLTAYLKSNGEITATDAAKIIGRSPATARRLLTQLVDEGVVVANGGNRNRKYKAIK
jgi:ATP-dependent DNA helicase RecG